MHCIRAPLSTSTSLPTMPSTRFTSALSSTRCARSGSSVEVFEFFFFYMHVHYACEACMRSMLAYYVFFLCMRSMHAYYACTRTMHAHHACALCMRTMHAHYACVLCMRTMYVLRLRWGAPATIERLHWAERPDSPPWSAKIEASPWGFCRPLSALHSLRID